MRGLRLKFYLFSARVPAPANEITSGASHLPGHLWLLVPKPALFAFCTSGVSTWPPPGSSDLGADILPPQGHTGNPVSAFPQTPQVHFGRRRQRWTGLEIQAVHGSTTFRVLVGLGKIRSVCGFVSGFFFFFGPTGGFVLPRVPSGRGAIWTRGIIAGGGGRG